MNPKLMKQIAITWELCGGTLSEGAKAHLVNKLEKYDPTLVSRALSRCEDECKGRITIADVISRIDDGHLGADEAWALMPENESGTVVWTQPMMRAYTIAGELLPDWIAARMAFKEAYKREVQSCKDSGEQLKWELSIGHREVQRDRVIKNAVARGWLTTDDIRPALPALADEISGALPAHDNIQLGNGSTIAVGQLGDGDKLRGVDDMPTESELSDIVGQLAGKLGGVDEK